MIEDIQESLVWEPKWMPMWSYEENILSDLRMSELISEIAEVNPEVRWSIMANILYATGEGLNDSEDPKQFLVY